MWAMNQAMQSKNKSSRGKYTLSEYVYKTYIV